MSYKPNLAEDFAFSDLHCHSYCSDGELSPRHLVERAAEKGVRILALTDHDTVDGVQEARAASHDYALKLIPGVELTALWGSGLFILSGWGLILIILNCRRISMT
ncbi:PHP domain-containing protein [Aliamphritea spongicola]|nr:PHP domain-containing protein [Aliamphritea spongicola]